VAHREPRDQRNRALTHYPSGRVRKPFGDRAPGARLGRPLTGILVSNGCLESITLALRAATEPRDIVALESPTYFGFLEILENLRLRALEIPTHPRTGLSLDALQLALDTQPVRAVLAVPTLSNPLGSCMPQSERRRLAQMMSAHGIPLIEDVIYNELAEQDDKRRAVKSFDETGHVMLCGSFSKTVSPGIRLGWIEGGRWHDKVARLKAATSGGQTPVMELALADLLSQPGYESGHRHLRSVIAARVDQARGVIARSFPKGTRVTDPPGGFILWVELPAALDTRALGPAGERASVSRRAPPTATPLRAPAGGRWDAQVRPWAELVRRRVRCGAAPERGCGRPASDSSDPWSELGPAWRPTPGSAGRRPFAAGRADERLR
jgi:DNA-binding transcriptional MocR family regulator